MLTKLDIPSVSLLKFVCYPESNFLLTRHANMATNMKMEKEGFMKRS